MCRVGNCRQKALFMWGGGGGRVSSDEDGWGLDRWCLHNAVNVLNATNGSKWVILCYMNCTSLEKKQQLRSGRNV